MTNIQEIRDRMDPEAARLRKENEDTIKRLTLQRRSDMRWLLEDARGRRIVYKLLIEDSNLMGSTLDANGETSDFIEGRRQLAISYAREIISTQPELWLQTLQEAMEVRGVRKMQNETEQLDPVIVRPSNRIHPAIAWIFVVIAVLSLLYAFLL